MPAIKDFVPPILLGPIRAFRRMFFSEAKKRRDATVPPAPKVKQDHVKDYAKRYDMHVFVETGTYLGEMVNAVRKTFKVIYSVELSKELHERAKQWFTDHEHIHLLQGDSGKVIAELTKKIDSPCLFWLDAHYSGGITARGDMDTPIVAELENIFSRPYKDVILIDDARCFIGEDQYPTIEFVESYTKEKRPEYKVSVKDDIIFIHP